MSETSKLDRRTVLKTIGGASATAALGGSALLAATTPAAAKAVLNVDISGTTLSNDAGHLNYVGAGVSKVLTWEGFDVPVKYIGFKHEISTDANTDGWHRLYPSPGNADDPDGFAVSPELPDWSGYGDDETVTEYTTDVNDYPEGTTGTIEAGVEWEVINDTGEPGSYPAFGYDGNGPQDPAQWASDLSEGADGASNTSTVTWKSTLRFYEDTDGSGGYIQVSDSDGIDQIIGEDTFDVKVTNEIGDTSGSGETGTTSSG